MNEKMESSIAEGLLIVLVLVGILSWGWARSVQRTEAIEKATQSVTTARSESAAQALNADAAALRDAVATIAPGGYMVEYVDGDARVTATIALREGGAFAATLEGLRNGERVLSVSGSGEWRQEGAVLAFHPKEGARGIVSGRYSIESVTESAVVLSDGTTSFTLTPQSRVDLRQTSDSAQYEGADRIVDKAGTAVGH